MPLSQCWHWGHVEGGNCYRRLTQSVSVLHGNWGKRSVFGGQVWSVCIIEWSCGIWRVTKVLLFSVYNSILGLENIDECWHTVLTHMNHYSGSLQANLIPEWWGQTCNSQMAALMRCIRGLISVAFIFVHTCCMRIGRPWALNKWSLFFVCLFSLDEVATGKLLDLAEGANVALVHSGTKQTESDPFVVRHHATENNNTVWVRQVGQSLGSMRWEEKNGMQERHSLASDIKWAVMYSICLHFHCCWVRQ